MIDTLTGRLGASARACRALYDPASGGYHLPPREANRSIGAHEVDHFRRRWREPMFDCVELPVADLLASLVLNTRSGRLLETGTSRGFSTSHLAAAADLVAGAQARVVTVDLAPAPHPFHLEARLAASIETVRADSLAVDAGELGGGRPFDFMLFDSLHTYGHLSREIARHVPSLKTGGLFVLHDSLFFDGLGLVVLALQRWPQFEVLTLPTHRHHRPGWRSPGVTLVRKLMAVAPGELRFPDLDDLLTHERAELQAGPGIVARTGGLFLDARYAAAAWLPQAGERTPASPGLLDPASAEAVPAVGAVAAPGAIAAPALPPPRGPADEALRQSQADWWRRHRDLEDGITGELPEAFEPPARQRVRAAIDTALAGCREVVALGHGEPRLRRWLQERPGVRSSGLDLSVEPLGDPRLLPAADGWVLHRLLHQLPGDAQERLLDGVRARAEPGARLVVVEPVCFPGHVPDAKDRALLDGLDELLAAPAEAARRAGLQPSAAVQALRERIATRWWGELPYGPAPLQKPFTVGELGALLASRFEVDAGPQVLQYLGGSHPFGTELALLAVDDPALAAQLMQALMPRLDALESALLRLPRLPDSAWYLALWTARVPRH